jgi:chitodextrinase
VALLAGQNAITVMAHDNDGFTASDTITITYTAGPGPDTTPPELSGVLPAPDATGIARNSSISFHLVDSGVGVDVSSIVLQVDGTDVVPQTSGAPDDVLVTYRPPQPFVSGATVVVSVGASDLAGNAMATVSWSFACSADLDTTPPPAPAGVLALGAGETYVILGWDPVAASDLGGYRVRYEGGGAQETIDADGRTSLRVEGLSPDTTYRFTVVAYDLSGNESAGGTAVEARTEPVADSGPGVSLYPNVVEPETPFVTIVRREGSGSRTTVLDVSGASVEEIEIGSARETAWTASELSNGIYFVVVGGETAARLVVRR